jgi:hypothetical protein
MLMFLRLNVLLLNLKQFLLVNFLNSQSLIETFLRVKSAFFSSPRELHTFILLRHTEAHALNAIIYA